MPVLAYHLILTCYGFWLPNDPRGSWSTVVRSIELYRAGGPATKTDTRRSVANEPHDADRRRDAKRALMYSPVVFNGTQAREVARGFAEYIASTQRIVHAACVMPDHAHLVIARRDMAIETIAEKLKGRATRFLKEADLHPMRTCGAALRGRLPSPWARGSWSVFLESPSDIRRTIQYVENNPIKAGLKPQRYAWVTPYDGP